MAEQSKNRRWLVKPWWGDEAGTPEVIEAPTREAAEDAFRGAHGYTGRFDVSVTDERSGPSSPYDDANYAAIANAAMGRPDA